MHAMRTESYKIVAGVMLIILFGALYLYLELSGLSNKLFSAVSLQATLRNAGLWGPVLIICLMAGAVVMSPIPSAPIAIASGFAYGHGWGTLYIVIGAEIGAVIAFGIARLVGYEAMLKRFGPQLNIGWISSSKHLMLAVCISRLVPFISFDVVSYAAGLTKLSYMQFAFATLIGIVPISFLLAHFGSEMVISDLSQIMLTILLLGMITIIPVIISVMIKRSKLHAKK